MMSLIGASMFWLIVGGTLALIGLALVLVLVWNNLQKDVKLRAWDPIEMAKVDEQIQKERDYPDGY